MKTTTNNPNASTQERNVAEAFHPGEYLREFLEGRGWSQVEFAGIIGRPSQLINDIIAGKRGITPETAKAFSAAFGTSPELWMNLDSAYQLWKSAPVSSEVTERANLRSKFPVRDLLNRGWIRFTENIEELKHELLEYYEIKDINESPRFQAAFKKAGDPEDPTPNQVAWIYRVKHVAETVPVPPYSKKSLEKVLERLEELRAAPEEVQHVPQALASCGVRLVIVEPLPSSKIDGMCLWLNSSPVIGLSLRYDRIDNFWFVLRHEIEHALNGDGKDYPMVDTGLTPTQRLPEGLPEREKKANVAAEEFCTPQTKLKNFLTRNQSIPSRTKVLGFARTLHIHEGIVVGQIHRQLDRYDLFRPMLVPIRNIITQTAVTDGYGHVITSPD